MAQRAVTIECTNCGNKFTVKHNHPEDVQFCPFCGESCTTPYDDIEERDDDLDDDRDPEELDMENDG